ncbi:hypothetical protein BVH65_08695 [Vibrio cholerae]|nr:hypothetical protein [Vibrio cholerae]MBO1370101.1 hypothetical protein [Vibrio cholerae]MBO1372994.1 hypothetical protein [Vibrio cholerae]MBO1377381.1 hypothetical protein [Vibrio cholerae]MBO1406841.1 hypothetical protein [Vibrio cholerae]
MQQDVSREHTINNGSSMADHDEHPIEQKEFYMLIGLDIGGTKIEICVLVFWNNKVCTLLKKFVHKCYLE